MSENDAAGAGPGAPLERSTVVALVAMALGVFVIANDFTALSVAVAPIEEDLDTTLNRAQWVINALLPEERAGLAGGLVIAVAGLGNAMGPLIAGTLTDALSWRWIFVVNVPVAAVAMFATWRNVAESEPGERVGFDWAGMATL